MPRAIINLPDFIILGANKAGTTTVAHWLAMHRQVRMSSAKEPMFFTSTPTRVSALPGEATLDNPFFVNTLHAYSDQFSGWKSDARMLGEASTSYLCNPKVAAPMIKTIVPDVKMIAILREPVSRAVSAFRMAQGNGAETRPFAEIIPDEPLRLFHRHGLRHYFANGLYGQQIAEYFRFFERSQFLFLRYDDLIEHPTETMRGVFSFLNIDEVEVDITKKLNTATDNQADDVTLTPEILKRLHGMYLEDISLTEKLTGLDLAKWKGSPQ